MIKDFKKVKSISTLDINYIKNTHWYRQGGAAKPIYISYPLVACGNFYLNSRPTKFFYNILMILKNGILRDYLNVDQAKEVVHFYLNKQLADKRFIYKARRYWSDYNLKTFIKLADKLDKADFESFTNRQLLKAFDNFSKIYMLLWRNAIFHDTFDIWGDYVWRSYIERANIRLTGSQVFCLLSYPKPSIIQRERIELIKIIKLVKSNKRLVRYIKGREWDQIRKSFPQLNRILNVHSNRYHFLQNDYAHIMRLDASYFWQKIVNLLTNRQLWAEEERFFKWWSNLSEQRRDLIKNKKINNELKAVADLLAIISNWRDDRKASNQLANSIIYKFVKELSRRLSTDREIIEQLLWFEVNSIFSFKKNKFDLVYKRERQGIYFYIPARNKFWQMDRRLSSRIIKIMEASFQSQAELRGMSAFPGKVKAKVKVILNQHDFHKLEPGDILVAPNTRPEYIVIMKKAAAVITEEGGITSHAAVVARELRKPTVVGVQGILDKVRDGDLVEVDADRGEVRVIR